MTSEFVLLIGIFAFVILGAFVGDRGPGATFQSAGPRLGAIVERNISVGHRFRKATDQTRSIYWSDPDRGAQ